MSPPAPHSPPLGAGIGLRPDHYRAVLAAGAGDDTSSVYDLDGFWLEVHPENYMTPGGPRLQWLDAIARRWPLSLHGVGASLGGADPVDADHLRRLCALVDRYEPALVSEHVAWSARAGVCYADLLPPPPTREALHALCANIDRMQSALGRTILIENPALYLSVNGDLAEPELLAEACRRTGCGLLLDVANVYVCEVNLGRDAAAYIDAIPPDLVGEIHLAGHRPDARLGRALLIDSHDAPVAEEVWELYAYALARLGSKPALVERDADIPPFTELMAERRRAAGLLSVARRAQGDLRAPHLRVTAFTDLEGAGKHLLHTSRCTRESARSPLAGELSPKATEGGHLERVEGATRSASASPPETTPLSRASRDSSPARGERDTASVEMCESRSLPERKKGSVRISGVARFQDAFARGLLAGEPESALAHAFRDPDWRPRYAVYRNNVVTALADAVVRNHPAVERLVGADFLRAAAAAFVRAHPATERDLTLSGAGFAAFLRAFPPAAGLPWLPDVAALDHAWVEALFAAAAPTLGPDDLGALGEDALPGLAPGLVPGARVVSSVYPAYTIWRANLEGDGGVSVDFDGGGETALLWRGAGAASGSWVRHRALAPGEAAFVTALARGATLAGASQAGLEADATLDIAAIFAGLLAAGVLARPTLEDAP